MLTIRFPYLLSRKQGGHALLRQSPSATASSSTAVSRVASSSSEIDHSSRELTTQPATKDRHNIVRDVIFPAPYAQKIMENCKKQGVSVQNAMFAVTNLAWLRVLERAKRVKADGVGGNAKVKEWANKCAGPTLMYSAVNLRPLVGPHAYTAPAYAPLTATQPVASSSAGQKRRRGEEKDIVPSSGAYVALGYFNIMLPGELPGSSSFSSSSRAAIERAEFWARARSTKQQTGDATRSPHLLSRNVLMGEERGARSVKFAMEDDGYVPRPSWVAGPPAPPAAATTKPASTPSSSLSPSKPAPVPTATTAKPPVAAALLGFSLLGSVDSLYHYNDYPSITPTLCRCGTRKAYGGILLFCYSFRDALYVTIGWDEKAFPEFDFDGEGVGIRAFYKEVRKIVGEFMLEDGFTISPNAPEVDMSMGVDVSGSRRLPEWAEEGSAFSQADAISPPAVVESPRISSRLTKQSGIGGRPLIAEMAKL